MPERFNSIKYKLLTGFVILTLNTVFLSSFSFYYFKKAEKIRILNGEIYELHVKTLQLIKLDNEFLNFGAINKDFYEHGDSHILKEREALNDFLMGRLKKIKAEAIYQNFNLGEGFMKLQDVLNQYNNTYSLILSKILKRGFKDYGLEGELRNYAHQLERDPGFKKETVLTLRRHEKDYFLRNENTYSAKLDSICNVLIYEFNLKEGDNLIKLQTIRNYQKTFKELSTVQEQIGFYNKNGLKHRLNQLNASLNSQFDCISYDSQKKVAQVISRGTWIYILTVVFSITLSLAISYLIASRLSRPIRKLSTLMDKYVMTRMIEDKKSRRRLSTAKEKKHIRKREKLKRMILSNDLNYSDEIQTLSNSFINLIQHTKDQFREIQQKSELLKSQNQELKKINVELDHFVYSAAHDLRSPLASLLGLIHLIGIEKDKEMVNGYLIHMKQSIYKLEGFIKDIVDYSKNNRIAVEVEEIKIREVINECFEVQQFVPGTEKIKRIVNVQEDFPFYNDKRRLTMILANFISNGLRYFDPSKENPYLEINVIINHNDAELSIRDNGIGISEEQINRVFEMFYRASESSKGSGLGLFIVKEAITKLDGNINVISNPGIGTKFTITLPNHYAVAHNRLKEKIG